MESQPQPSSSVQPQTEAACAHVSTQVRRQAERQVSCRVGHSRHVVVHRSAGAHLPFFEHQPHPGASAEQEHRSVAAAHTASELTLRCATASGEAPRRPLQPSSSRIDIGRNLRHGA